MTLIAAFLLLSALTPHFTVATGEAGLATVKLVSGSESKDYIMETLGTGVAAFDFDNDGWQDLYFANGSRLEGFPAGKEPLPRLFRNRGDGTFEDVSKGSGLSEPFWGIGVAVGDYDNDGFTDLYVTAYGPNRLYRNKGDGTFEPVGHQAGVDDPRLGSSAAFADFDGDGCLDLYAATYIAFDPATVPRRGDPQHPCMYRGIAVSCGPTGLPAEPDILYRNNGDGTFTDVTRSAGIRTDIGMYGLGVAVADYDDDGDIDIYVANDVTPNQLYRNRGDGTFEEVGALSGVAYGSDGIEQASMGTSFGDYDGDGRLDLVVTNFSHQFYQLFRNMGQGFFSEVTFETGLATATYLSLGWATDLFDYDLDGDQDLFFANGHVYPTAETMQTGITYRQRSQLLENVPGPAGSGERVFVDVSDQAGEGFSIARSHRAGGPFDYDRDGDLDLVLTEIDGGVTLLRNELPHSNRWIAFRPVGRAGNRSGIGTRFLLTAGRQVQLKEVTGSGSYLWGCDPRAHFGLGDAVGPVDVEVIWPGGRRQKFSGLPIGREFVVVEGADRPVEKAVPKR